MADQEGLESEVASLLKSFEERTLSGMRGHFSRLIYLASLRDYNTGRYRHYGLETHHSAQVVDEGLRRCHLRVFGELVALPLRAQTEDLINFFESLKEDRARLVDAWQRLRGYQVLPPVDCHPLARELFDKNVEIILKILRETDLWPLLHDPHGDSNHLA